MPYSYRNKSTTEAKSHSEAEWADIVNKNAKYFDLKHLKTTKNAKKSELGVIVDKINQKEVEMRVLRRMEALKPPTKPPVSTPDPNRAFRNKRNGLPYNSSLLDWHDPNDRVDDE